MAVVWHLLGQCSQEAFAVKSGWRDIAQSDYKPVGGGQIAQNSIGCYKDDDKHEVDNLNICFLWKGYS